MAGGSTPSSPSQCSAVCSPPSRRRERTDRNVISVQVSEQELLSLCVRIHLWLLFEPSDEAARPLKCKGGIIGTEEQQEPVAACPVTGLINEGCSQGAFGKLKPNRPDGAHRSEPRGLPLDFEGA